MAWTLPFSGAESASSSARGSGKSPEQRRREHGVVSRGLGDYRSANRKKDEEGDMHRSFVLIIGLLVTSFATGEAATQIYQAEGVVRFLNPKEEILVVEHGQITGFSAAMTMSYQVKSPDLLRGLDQGDRITFKIDGATRVIIEVNRLEAKAQSDEPAQDRRTVAAEVKKPGPGATKAAVLGANPRVVRDVLAMEVIDREPAEVLPPIPAEIGRLYYFTEVLEGGSLGEILHVWTWQDRDVGEIPLRVGGGRFRTWSYKTIPPSWTGEWRVEARTPDGRVLSSESFVVEADERSPEDSEEPALEQSSER